MQDVRRRVPGTDRVLIKPRHSLQIGPQDAIRPQDMAVINLDGDHLAGEHAPPGMRITAGEYGYDSFYFRRMLEVGAVDVLQADLFPEGRAALVVCNPPWVPARPSSSLEQGIYDPESRMLRGFLNALPEHLERDGEGWLILSDLAEHLGLRPRVQQSPISE